jgi:hypothetical protein
MTKIAKLIIDKTRIHLGTCSFDLHTTLERVNKW